MLRARRIGILVGLRDIEQAGPGGIPAFGKYPAASKGL
jgi:hypothetical protein